LLSFFFSFSSLFVTSFFLAIPSDFPYRSTIPVRQTTNNGDPSQQQQQQQQERNPPI
jgi:hypothetical protein